MKKEKSATQDVLNYLKKHKRGITQVECFEKFGATRLGAIIFELRKRGYDIDTVDDVHVTRYGIKTTVARYVLNDKR